VELLYDISEKWSTQEQNKVNSNISWSCLSSIFGFCDGPWCLHVYRNVLEGRGVTILYFANSIVQIGCLKLWRQYSAISWCSYINKLRLQKTVLV